MSTLQIKKLESGTFKHIDSIDGSFFLGRFSFKQELNKAFLVEAYGAKRREYSINEISVYNFGGTEELFTNWDDLLNRLTDLGYTGIETNGIIPTASSYVSSDANNALELGTDNKLFVAESNTDQSTITTNTTLSNAYNNKIIKVKSNSTITIPTGLDTNFNCVFRCFVGATANFVGGAGVTMDAQTGLNLLPYKMATLFKDGALETFVLTGETSV